jgi:hypothetical protein
MIRIVNEGSATLKESTVFQHPTVAGSSSVAYTTILIIFLPP